MSHLQQHLLASCVAIFELLEVKTKNSDLNDTILCATCNVRFCDDVQACC